MRQASLALLLLLLMLGAMSLAGGPALATVVASGNQADLRATDLAPEVRPDNAPQASTIITVSLPLVFYNYRYTPQCSPDSPFSLEIAALHQVEDGAGPGSKLWQTPEEQWLTRYEEGFPTLVDALQESGACWTRLRIGWEWIQRNPPPADYAWHDDQLALVASTGVQIIGIIDGVPWWAGSSSLGPIYSGRIDEFVAFLTDVVRRYKDPPYNIHHWELFNEPDKVSGPHNAQGWGNNGDLYAQMLSVAYPAIKAADPDATVLMGGIAHDWFLGSPDWGPFNRYFPDTVMENNGHRHLDALNLHYFPDYRAAWERWIPSSPERLSGQLPAPSCGDVFDGEGRTYEAWGVDLGAKVTHFANRMSICHDVDLPLWITELGESGRSGEEASLARQARYVIQGYTRGLASGAENITWFALVSPPYDPNQQGLLYEDDWSPKPAFFAFQTLTRELRAHRYIGSVNSPGVEGYKFLSSSGQTKTVAWGSFPASVPGILRFAPARLVRIVDRDGTTRVVFDGEAGDWDRVRDGAIELGMTHEPLFISVP